MQGRHGIDGMRLAADGEAVDPEFELRADFLECGIGALATGEAVGENSDVMSALGLSNRKIEDVTEDTTDRRADRVQDAKGRTGSLRHRQNHRSATTTVSPGFRSVPGGTTA